jgi:hypothetical protein
MKRIAALVIFTTGLIFGQTHSVTLNWNDTQTATYNLYKSSGTCLSSPTFSQLRTGITAKTAVDSTVTTGQYAYVVTAVVAGAGESPYSNCADALVPAWAPTGVTAGSIVNGTVPITWADTQAGTWSVSRSPGACPQVSGWTKLVSGLTAKTYSDPAVPVGSSCYAVSATLNGVESPLSTGVTVNRATAAPSGLSVVVQ